MPRRRAFTLPILALAVGLAGVTSQATASQAAPGQQANQQANPEASRAATAAEQSTIDFRARNGMNADLAHVRMVADRARTDGPTREASAEFGVPLLPKENAHFRNLIALSEAAERAVDRAAGASPVSGVWLDAGVPNISTTRPLSDQQKASAESALPGGNRVTWTSAKYSYERLKEIAERFAADSASLAADGMVFGSFRIDQVANKIAVVREQPSLPALLDAYYDVPGMFSLDDRPEVEFTPQAAGDSRDRRSGFAYGGLWMSPSSAMPTMR